jgi:hypothetical protein
MLLMIGKRSGEKQARANKFARLILNFFQFFLQIFFLSVVYHGVYSHLVMPTLKN